MDCEQLDQCWTPLGAALDRTCLNDLPGLDNPTSERLAAWLWARLQPQLPALSWITVYETATAGCHYDGRHYRIWKERRFESALRLNRAPLGDPRRRLHGHSYQIRLHLTAPLDEVMGWTVDYGEVKALFEPAYRQLDHHRLDQLAGLDDADPASLLHWIKAAGGAATAIGPDRSGADPWLRRDAVLGREAEPALPGVSWRQARKCPRKTWENTEILQVIIRHDLCSQGNFLHAARRRCPHRTSAVFCRFAGCNLWSGRAADRTVAICRFCDTDFVGTNGTGGGKFADAKPLAAAIAAQWPISHLRKAKPCVVCTGGEPIVAVTG